MGFVLTYDLAGSLHVDLACGTRGVVGRILMPRVARLARWRSLDYVTLDATSSAEKKWSNRGFAGARMTGVRRVEKKWFHTGNDERAFAAMQRYDEELARYMREGGHVAYKQSSGTWMRASLEDEHFVFHGARMRMPV
jgi:hypothetical protein